MRVVALISGGKDSCYNMMHCVANGHDIVALANLRPDTQDELDSHMFQTVGHDVIELYAEAMQLPLFRRTITGSSVCTTSDYTENKQDEVEDLYELLKEIKEQVDYDAVSSGAILSNYQRVRVENVSRRLGLQSLSYLWQRNQEELLSEMIQADLEAILIKVASLGLNPKVHLGKTLKELSPHLHLMNKKYELNVCGEGGEYETLTLDCPLFVRRIVVDKKRVVIHSDDAFAPVGYLVFDALRLEDKGTDKACTLMERLRHCDLVIPKTLETEDFQHMQTIDFGKGNIDLRQTNSEKKGCDFVHPSTPKINICSGRGWITELFAIQANGCSIEEATSEAVGTLENTLSSNDLSMEDISLVNLFCSSMKNFSKINSIYKKFFLVNPPARVCVEIPLPENIAFKMDVCIDKSQDHPRKALHVESISYWAPANIGPYSQVVEVFPRIYFSGSIGMDPSSLNVVDGGFEQEATLALHHVHEVAKVFTRNTKKHHGMATCYIAGYISKADFIVALFNNQTMFAASKFLLNIICVPSLPKGALVEWHIMVTQHAIKEDIYDFNGDDEGTGNLGDQQFAYNKGFFKLSLCRDENLDENLRRRFSQHSANLMKSDFMRVYYVLNYLDVPENSFHSSFTDIMTSVTQKSLAISYIPVNELENGAAILVTGVNSVDC